MKYWDTSALLRAWREGWRPAGGLTLNHTRVEWVHIMAGRGLVYRRPDGSEEKRNLPRPVAVSEAVALTENLQWVDLTAGQVAEALERWSDIPGLKANSIFDFLHIRAAELHHASRIVTLNLTEWARMTKLRLEPPIKTLSP